MNSARQLKPGRIVSFLCDCDGQPHQATVAADSPGSLNALVLLRKECDGMYFSLQNFSHIDRLELHSANGNHAEISDCKLKDDESCFAWFRLLQSEQTTLNICCGLRGELRDVIIRSVENHPDDPQITFSERDGHNTIVRWSEIEHIDLPAFTSPSTWEGPRRA